MRSIALRNYERFHGKTVGTATLTDLRCSSAGIQGWYNTDPTPTLSGPTGPGVATVEPTTSTTPAPVAFTAAGQPIIIHLDTGSHKDDFRVRKAESDTIDVPGWPTYLQLEQYMVKLKQRLCLASAWGDDAEAD